MLIEAVGFFQNRSYAALCFPGIAVCEFAFCDYNYVSFFCDFQGGSQAGYSAAYYQAICEKLAGGDSIDVNQVTSQFLLYCHFITSLILKEARTQLFANSSGLQTKYNTRKGRELETRFFL